MPIIANSVIVKHYVNRVRLLYYYIIPTAVPYSLNCPNLNVGKLRAVRTHAANTGYSPMLFQRWLTVFDAGQTLKQHRVKAPCLLRKHHGVKIGAKGGG